MQACSLYYSAKVEGVTLDSYVASPIHENRAQDISTGIMFVSKLRSIDAYIFKFWFFELFSLYCEVIIFI